MPLRNLWKSRHDPGTHVRRPAPARAIFLGDGVSLDRVDGSWRDRFGEPLIAALEASGHDTFLMQGGYLSRLPWYRPTFAANVVESRGFLRALTTRPRVELPGHDEVLAFIMRNDVNAPSLGQARLGHSANSVVATAGVFERVLRVVKPTFAFVVTYYAGLGPAFVLACRRQGILSVDLQRCPHASAPHAYRWTTLPARGYAMLPARFWSWTKDDVARVAGWAAGHAPWHGAIHGGHTQLAPYHDDQHPAMRTWDEKFGAISEGAKFEREILVALQPIHGHRAVWDALRSQVEASPKSWRWWIRRHPASRPDQDVESAGLLALRRPNVVITEASAFPLPVLLRHMSVVVSLSSGAAVEASMFGVPALFLIDAARHPFADVIARGLAAVIDVGTVNEEIAGLQPRLSSRAPAAQPDVGKTLLELEEHAAAYRRACH